MAEKKNGHMYTVSRLTRKIKFLLEESFSFVWITGEISNYAVPASGHSYFTLKDSQSVIQAVMFKNQKRNLKFLPENGMKIFGLARITLYEPRGSYQLVFEHIEPAGTGSIQLAFEQLKSKLKDKGLFDDIHKKPIPFLPEKICVITSGTGAALRDILQISQRRFFNRMIDIIPVMVQGDEACRDICRAIQLAADISKPDVIILARGGGSLEDLQAFNSEPVATAIFDCSIPIITGIGHETDFTIADFVADLRAPTPSAAAELAVPDKQDLLRKINAQTKRIQGLFLSKINDCRETLSSYTDRLKTPETIIYHNRLLLEDYQSRLDYLLMQQLQSKKQTCRLLIQSLSSFNPTESTRSCRKTVTYTTDRLNRTFDALLYQFKFRLSKAISKLDALSPREILNRGYSITRKVPGHQVIKNADDVEASDLLEIILSNGRLTTKVVKTHG